MVSNVDSDVSKVSDARAASIFDGLADSDTANRHFTNRPTSWVCLKVEIV